MVGRYSSPSERLYDRLDARWNAWVERRVGRWDAFGQLSGAFGMLMLMSSFFVSFWFFGILSEFLVTHSGITRGTGGAIMFVGGFSFWMVACGTFTFRRMTRLASKREPVL